MAEEALSALDAQPLDGWWIHLDVDLLDRSVMPTVDSPNVNGLDLDELVDAVAVFLAAPKAIGLEVAIYDPELDPDGVYARRLTDALVAAFERAGRLGARRGR